MEWTALRPRRHRRPAVADDMKWALELGFLPKTVNHLAAKDIRTREQLCQTTRRQLLAIPTVSETQLKKVRRALGPAATDTLELDQPFWTPQRPDED